VKQPDEPEISGHVTGVMNIPSEVGASGEEYLPQGQRSAAVDRGSRCREAREQANGSVQAVGQYVDPGRLSTIDNRVEQGDVVCLEVAVPLYDWHALSDRVLLGQPRARR
jgi:hypothetical protein